MCSTQIPATYLMRCSNNYTQLLNLYILESCMHMQREQFVRGFSPLNTNGIDIYGQSLRNSPPVYHPEKGKAWLVTWKNCIQKDIMVKRKLRNQIIIPTKKASTIRKFCISQQLLNFRRWRADIKQKQYWYSLWYIPFLRTIWQYCLNYLAINTRLALAEAGWTRWIEANVPLTSWSGSTGFKGAELIGNCLGNSPLPTA